MTNFDRWQYFMSGFSSPQSFIDWGYYSLIAAALQRRVWLGPPHSPLFPNMNTILVADPGIGKGLVIKQVYDLLTYHKLDANRLSKQFALNTASNDEKVAMEFIANEDFKNANTEHNRVKTKQSLDKPLLFPVAADATTYEALVRAISNSVRRINYRDIDPNTGKEKMGLYTHSSISICLEELSSMMRKKTEDLINFIIKTYDAGDYTYDTKTQGKDRIKKCCLNFLGGTTPAFLQSTFDDYLLTEGFSSRTFFIYAAKNRKSSLFIPDLNSEQKAAYAEIAEHIYKLAHLYGHIKVEQEVMDWLEKWWIDFNDSGERPNKSTKLLPYYGRKNIHVLKLAMALHFSDSTELFIRRETFERALFILEQAEKTMHCALAIEKANPLASVTSKILKHLQINGRQSRKNLLSEFWGCFPNPAEDLDKVLEHLLTDEKIEQLEEPHAITKNTVLYYQIKKSTN